MNNPAAAAAVPLLNKAPMRTAAGPTKFGASKKGKALFWLMMFVFLASVLGVIYMMWAGMSGQRDKKRKD